MQVTFLGTSGAIPTTARNPSALLIEREGDRLLFDCGEGTQRQMMRFQTGFDIEHIFLTHCHGDHTLGLPGLLQTWDFQERERQLTIYVPAGKRRTVRQLINVAENQPGYPIEITEVTAGDVVLDHDEYEIQAFAVDHDTRSVGYALIEDERKGRFDREKAEMELGIPPGPKYSKLHDGEPVEHNGRTIHPDAVVGEPRPGRTVVYTGDTRPTDSTKAIANEAELLIHDGTFGDEHLDRAKQTAHSTARQAATVAKEANVDRLALTHISTRHAADVWKLEDQASEVFGDDVIIAEDGMSLTIPYPDSEQSFTVEQLD